MNKKNLFYIWIILLAVVWSIILSWPRQNNFVACDVGQGDAILITSGFNQVLIDGGPNDKVLNCLSENMPFWDRKIEMVVNTHPDKDHYYGLEEVFKRYQVEGFVTNNLINPSEYFKDFRQIVLEKEVKIITPKKGDILKINELKFKILWPEEQQDDYYAWDKDLEFDKRILGERTKGFNNSSIVMLFSKNDFNVLLTGDIESEIEEKIASENEIKELEVLKIAHHGSKYSTSEQFLNLLKPQVAIISVGKNPWGHPTKEVLERLEKNKIKIYRTDKEEIKINMDAFIN